MLVCFFLCCRALAQRANLGHVSSDKARDLGARVAEQDVNTLTEAAARDELARLAEALAAANTAYHTEDAPEISDAEYDRLKQRNAAIETRFPELKRADSPS